MGIERLINSELVVPRVKLLIFRKVVSEIERQRRYDGQRKREAGSCGWISNGGEVGWVEEVDCEKPKLFDPRWREG